MKSGKQNQMLYIKHPLRLLRLLDFQDFYLNQKHSFIQHAWSMLLEKQKQENSSFWQDGKADVVANDAGDRVTPAVVAFTDHDQVSLWRSHQCTVVEYYRDLDLDNTHNINITTVTRVIKPTKTMATHKYVLHTKHLSFPFILNSYLRFVVTIHVIFIHRQWDFQPNKD